MPETELEAVLDGVTYVPQCYPLWAILVNDELRTDHLVIAWAIRPNEPPAPVLARYGEVREERGYDLRSVL
jgi:hypothetical protein